MPQLTRITRDPAVIGGKPCIRGMRITVGTVVGLVAVGRTSDEILREFMPCLGERGEPPRRCGSHPSTGQAIVLEPDGGRLKITLKGDLDGMLSAARDSKRSPDTGDLFVPVHLVAGARNPLNLEFA